MLVKSKGGEDGCGMLIGFTFLSIMILFRTFNCLNYTPAAPAAPSAASPRPASCHCQRGWEGGGQDEKLLKLGIHFPICQCM